MNTSARKLRLAKKMRGKAPEVVINPMTTSNNIVIIPVWGRLYPLGAGRRIHRSLLGEDIYPPCHKGMDGKSGKNAKENLIMVDCDTPMLKSIYTNEHITEKW